MTAIRMTAAIVALTFAGVVQAATISVVDKGDVDTSGIGGAVHSEFQVYQFTVARTTEAQMVNAIDVTVTSSVGEIHQLWAELNDFGDYYYTFTPGVGGVSSSRQTRADSYFMESKFALNVVPRNEDMLTVIGDGNTINAHYSGPASTIDPEVSANNIQAGFGTSFEFVGAVPTGSEQESYTVYQLVIPDALAGYITVVIEATTPSSPIYSQEFVFGEAPVIPEPASIAMLGLGALLLARRQRRAA